MRRDNQNNFRKNLPRKNFRYKYPIKRNRETTRGIHKRITLRSCSGKYIYDRTRNCNDNFVRKLLTKLEVICRRHIRVCFPDKIGYIVNELNSFNETIQFTLEIEENKLACLYIIEIRNSNDTINNTSLPETNK